MQSRSLFTCYEIRLGERAAQLGMAVPLNNLSALEKPGDLVLGRCALQVEMTYDTCQHISETSYFSSRPTVIIPSSQITNQTWESLLV